jgi:hypothetical protein
MAQREGSIYLYLFIGSFVLFVVAVVFAVIENSGKGELQTALTAAKNEKKTVDDQARRYADDLRMLKGLMLGADNKDSQTAQVDDTCRRKMTEAQDAINKVWQERENRSPIVFNDMTEAYEKYKDLVQKILDAEKQASELQKLALKDKEEAVAQTKEDVKKKDETIAAQKTQLDETEKKYESKVTQLTRDTERLQRDLATARDEMATKEIEMKRREAVDKNLIASLQTRLDKLNEDVVRVKSIEDVEPDGQILDVAGNSGIAWVDIGRKQFLRPGIEFQVFQTIKGGRRQVKGRVEIQLVEEKASQVRILETTDDLNPIAKGDSITSPFYDPRAVPIFVFAGKGLESKKITEDALRSKIKGYGAQIQDEITKDTTFLVVLKEEDNNAKDLKQLARTFGIPFLREQDILQFMGF